MTIEELATTQGAVVCPQCLNEFHVDGVTLPPRHAAVRTAGPLQHYCHDCGAHLPQEGLRFCPYCGVSLEAIAAPPDDEAATPEAEPAATPEAAPAPRGHKFKLNSPLIHGIPQDYTEVMGTRAIRRTYITLIVLLSLTFIGLLVAILLQQ